MAIVYNLKGGIHLGRQDRLKAENSFQQAITANPNFLRPYYALAKIYLMDKKEEKAIAQYKTILEKNPKQAGPHMILGTLYDMQQQFDLSENHYRQALKINPDFAPAANNLAFLLAEYGDKLDEALALAQKAKEIMPEDPNIMDTLGWIYYKKGFYDNARSEFLDCLEKMPDNAIVRYHLGLTYYKKGNNDLARIELEKAVGLDDQFNGVKEAKRILAEL
jgi:tetratricopeptide (TPR) repeat protein